MLNAAGESVHHATNSPAAFAKAIDEKTKALYVESIGNPEFNIPDFRALATLAHGEGLPAHARSAEFRLEN